ncbi:MAG: signal transduction histidine kinase/CheY-like chemotaxis protein [Thermoproteota archaeon]|jgi:signal transduction histidine kinase/CheY-like chemotaxis protein
MKFSKNSILILIIGIVVVTSIAYAQNFTDSPTLLYKENGDNIFLAFIFSLFFMGAYITKGTIRSNEDHNQLQRLNELNGILSSTPSCLKIITKDGLLISMNRQGLDLIEAENLEMVYKANVYDIVEESHRQSFIDFNNRVCSGSRESLIFEIIGLNGTRRHMESYSAPYKLENGETAHIAITNDITIKVNLEQKYRKQKALTQHHTKLASIGELAAGVGHEINNPLAIIKGYISIMNSQNEKNDNDIDKYMTKINLAISRISKIVEGLRTFSRSDSNESVEFSPLEAIDETFNLLYEIYRLEGIDFSLSKKSYDEHFIIDANRGNFQQVLMNLISNAKDAVSKNENKKIEISLDIHESTLIVKVIDNGHGIPKEIFEKVFDPFFTTKDVNKGTGIGLSLAYNFINKMNGTICFKRNVKQGTTAIVEIPLNIQKIIKPASNLEQNEEDLHKYKVRAIVADDEEDLREILLSILNNMGIDVSVVENGKLALELYTKSPEKFDFIISDMNMPVMDGPTLLKTIRSLKNIKQPKFIFITGGVNIDFENNDNELNRLIDGYFLKPFNEETIIEVISYCLKNEHKSV